MGYPFGGTVIVFGLIWNLYKIDGLGTTSETGTPKSNQVPKSNPRL